MFTKSISPSNKSETLNQHLQSFHRTGTDDEIKDKNVNQFKMKMYNDLYETIPLFDESKIEVLKTRRVNILQLSRQANVL